MKRILGLFLMLVMFAAPAYADAGKVSFELIEQYLTAVQNRNTQEQASLLREQLSQDRVTLKYMRENMPEQFVVYSSNGLILRLQALRAKYRTLALSIPSDIGLSVIGPRNQILNDNLRTNQQRVRSVPNNTQRTRDTLNTKIRNNYNRVGVTRRNNALKFPNRDRQSNQTSIRNRVRSMR